MPARRALHERQTTHGIPLLKLLHLLTTENGTPLPTFGAAAITSAFYATSAGRMLVSGSNGTLVRPYAELGEERPTAAQHSRSAGYAIT
jgi:hypothetical protein